MKFCIIIVILALLAIVQYIEHWQKKQNWTLSAAKQRALLVDKLVAHLINTGS